MDSGAKLLASSRNTQKAKSILQVDPDRYVVADCGTDPTWLIIQLSEDIVLDTFSLANLEHYSTGFRDFQLLGSSKYPTDKWILLGNFRLAKSHGIQEFTLHRPEWTRYLK